MNTNINPKKQCVTCNKSNGILICNGCQQIFCGKHVIEHRQDLSGQLDNIMQEYDVLQNDIEQISYDNVLLQKINQWEKESIEKIQITADNARKNLQKLLDQSKEDLSKKCHNMAINLRSSREADDYSENDFNYWIEQLKTFKLEISSPSSIKINQNNKSVIHLITIENNDNKSTKNEQRTLSTSLSNTILEEKFLDTFGPVKIENEGYLAKHTGSTRGFSYIRGHLLYSQGSHTIRFKLEQYKQPYHIFFGCISSQTDLKENIFNSNNAVGWFGFSQVYEHGRCSTNCKKYGYNSCLIQINDILRITFDCNNKQIKLFNERLNKISTLMVNINKIPYPWRLLMVLVHKGDCVKILPKT